MEICIDFDGTCVSHEFPKIGNDIGSIPVLKKLTDLGHNLILFTMRSDIDEVSSDQYDIHKQGGEFLTDAVNWFIDNNIPLYGINTNPKQSTWTHSPKAYGQLYIDDAALGIPLKTDPEISDRPFVDWVKVELLLIKNHIISEPDCKDCSTDIPTCNGPAQPIETNFVERLRIEFTELSDRIDKLDVFTASEKFKSLSKTDRDLLEIQLYTMDAYKQVLRTRIELIAPEILMKNVAIPGIKSLPSKPINDFKNFEAGSCITIKSPHRHIIGVIDENSKFQMFHFSEVYDVNANKVYRNKGYILSAVDECYNQFVWESNRQDYDLFLQKTAPSQSHTGEY